MHKAYSFVPYITAGGLAILTSVWVWLNQFLINLPAPVVGGMSLFLCGLIAAPGVQVLVEQQVDYRKISNQIVTASVLIVGISAVALNIGESVEFRGMSLGLLVGIIVNGLVKIFESLGVLNEVPTFSETFKAVISHINGTIYKEYVLSAYASESQDYDDAIMKHQDKQKSNVQQDKDKYSNEPLLSGGYCDTVVADDVRKNIERVNASSCAVFYTGNNSILPLVIFEKPQLQVFFPTVLLSEQERQSLQNDYPDSVFCTAKHMQICLNGRIPVSKLKSIVSNVRLEG